MEIESVKKTWTAEIKFKHNDMLYELIGRHKDGIEVVEKGRRIYIGQDDRMYLITKDGKEWTEKA